MFTARRRQSSSLSPRASPLAMQGEASEAPPNREERREHRGIPNQNPPSSPQNRAFNHQPGAGSPSPLRKDTGSSSTTNNTLNSQATLASGETASTSYGVESPNPNYAAQAVFSVNDGNDIAAQRRASRRRTGPLSQLQRERAHLIRRIGACNSCRRRRVAVSLPTL